MLLYYIIAFFQIVFCVALVGLILLHSGKDAGLSGAFGIGGGGSSIGGGSMVERNLDRATVFFAVLFALNTFILLKIVALFVPLRMSEADMETGDIAVHGHEVYPSDVPSLGYPDGVQSGSASGSTAPAAGTA